MSPTCFEPRGFILRKTVVNEVFFYSVFKSIGVSSLAGGRNVRYHTENALKLSSWRWTHEVRKM